MIVLPEKNCTMPKCGSVETERGTQLIYKKNKRVDNRVYKLVASRLESTRASARYSLRSRDRARTKITATNRFGDFVTNKYATDST